MMKMRLIASTAQSVTTNCKEVNKLHELANSACTNHPMDVRHIHSPYLRYLNGDFLMNLKVIEGV